MYPAYSYPKRVRAALIIDALRGHHRSFAADARSSVARLRPAPRVLGAQNIPRGGPYVITPNHYYRPGYASQWTALSISANVSAEVHWVMTGELTFPGKWYAAFAIPIYRFALDRIASVYDFTTMPPMPPRPGDRQARAAAVRAVLRRVGRTEGAVIGLAPEGGDQPGGRLSLPPSGVGRFCLLLAAAGLGFLPVGVYECDGQLTLNFGPLHDLHPASVAETQEKDKIAASTVMQQIAPLLPAELRGEFR